MNTPSPSEIQKTLNRRFKMRLGAGMVEASDDAVLATVNPATEEVVGHIPNASPDDVDKAVVAASAAQRNWARLPYVERRSAIMRVATILRENTDLLGLLDTVENGAIFHAMRAGGAYAADRIEYFCGIGHEVRGETTQLDDSLRFTRREPFGVVVRLLPFNHPTASAGVALAVPLLMGNAVILKPSPHTSLSAMILGELIGGVLPDGIFNVVTGDTERVAQPLVAHPGVDRLSLTGSVKAGQSVMRVVAERLVPLTMELGGKNPLIVFPDADVGTATEIAVASMNFGWQSHSCGATTRVLVHASLEEEFTSCLKSRLEAIKVGPPFSPEAEMGAISTREIYERCLAASDKAIQQGARLVTGARRPQGAFFERGHFLLPTLFDKVRPDMEIAQSEIFGPLLSVSSWDSFDDMIAVANGLPLGLTAVIVTNDLHAAHTAAAEIKAGYVEVNGKISHALGTPFGGIRMSGFGREGNLDELLSYTQVKSVNVNFGSPSFAVLGGT